MDVRASTTELILSAGWVVSRIGGDERLKVDFPNDLHTALLAEGIIDDPYWRDREASLDWVHASEWIAEREFDWPGAVDGPHFLTLSSVDCHAIVSLNDVEIGTLGNRFRRFDLDVTEVLTSGTNRLQIRFLSNSAVAKARADAAPFPVPFVWHNRLPHYNFLRKPQCDAGWDWGIALSPLGIYGDIRLRPADPVRLDDVSVRQSHETGAVTVEVDLHTQAHTPATTTAEIGLDGQTVRSDVSLWPGENRTRLSIRVENPRLWWPVGHGPQEFYDLKIRLGPETRNLRIGLRQIELVTDKDDIGSRFAFRINGREIFMRGANWIPADALPAHATPERVADLLDSALMANMNMIRVWGGGTYEPDWFYEMCSDRGLLVWQDFMFACNLYPATDRTWLNDVRVEARQNVRRLSTHPCVALWCGDNELVGALNWFEESKKDRDRYFASYTKLNFALEEIVDEEDLDVPWWPSSPCVGPLNYGDSWHDDTSGDMHFWDVWHDAKDFEHYRTVRPRFCSEFGFQSFPSPALVETFTEPEDRNASSRVMEVHQRNEGGNDRIVETISRYFHAPQNFDEMCWLSQVSQGLAMKTAIEFWRAAKPRTMGTLYWQLNDTWPVASWSSLEYGGGWKLVHYLARRFYAPVMVTAQPDDETAEIVIWAINDTPEPVTLDVSALRVDVTGPLAELGGWTVHSLPDRAVEVARLPTNALTSQEVLNIQWSDRDSRHIGDSDYWPNRPKSYALLTPDILVTEQGREIVFETDVPAFFVTHDFGGRDIWSDNCFTLLPGRPKRVQKVRQRSGLTGSQDLKWLSG